MEAEQVRAALAQLPHDHQLSMVLTTYGQECQISQDPETGVWLSIERPKPSQTNVIVGKSVPELAAKLAEAYGSRGLELRLGIAPDGDGQPPLPRRHPG